MRISWMVALVVSASAPAQANEAEEPSADSILQRAIDVQERHEEEGNEVKYDYDLVSVTEKLDKRGDVEDVHEQLYRSHHIDGIAYERLVKKDGRELGAKELAKERKREERFRKKIAKGEAKHNDADDRVAFDEELLSRYDIDYVDIRSISGRDCYVLRFEPKPGKLPVKRTVDRALNNAEGHLWIDTESFEIARVEFALREKISLWWGMMGSVSKMTGLFQRHPMPDNIWLPETFDFYMRGRVLFRSIHVRQHVVWNEFKRKSDTVADNPE